MVTVTLDGVRCDLWEGYTLPKELFRLDLTAAADVQRQRSGRSVELLLPSSVQNDELMCYAADPCCGERFNAVAHEAIVEVDGVELMRGVAHLVAIEHHEGRLSYRLRVRSGGSDWVESASRTPLREALSEYEAILNGSTIRDSWEGDAKVRFLPVCYDDYRVPYDQESLYPPQRVMTVADYYPFISVEHLLREAVERAGYELGGEWVESEEFRSLMMSGKYVEGGRSVSRLKSFAGFEAGRTSTAVTTADGMGRAWLSPLVLTSSLGAVVTTTEGEGLYNNNLCLNISDQGVLYTPFTELTVGFEYYLKYTTDYEILSRTRLRGFDSIYLGEGCDIEFELANPFVDMRADLQSNMEYRCVVFDHQEGTRYRIICNHGTQQTVVGSFSERSCTFAIPIVDYHPICMLMVLSDDGTSSVYKGDWAIYEAHVELTGQKMVELTVQSPPERVSPSVGKSFNQLYLHGASQGQQIELSQECRMRPLFSATPAYGSQLSFDKVAAHNMQLIDVVEALQQMYNLRIYTDEAARKVYITPRDGLYRGDEWDWSERVDLSQPISAEDLALHENERFTLAYRTEGDGAVARFNASAEEPFAEWSGEVASHAAVVGEHRSVNHIFTPTISSTPYAEAPSAMVMQVGDRDGDEVAGVSARIVRYMGMRSLPSGERWGFPQNGYEYPFAAFHAPDEFTLCFDDCDGEQGLHRHYDEQLRELSLRRRLRLVLRLKPVELQSLAQWESAEANLRSTFVLKMSGQRAKYHLEAVESYDIEQERAVCRFVRQTND